MSNFLTPIIAVINKSSIQNKDVITMVKACQYQLNNHFDPAWNTSQWFIIFYQDESKVPERAYPIYIFNKCNTPDAYSYYATNAFKPHGNVFIEPILNNNDGGILYNENNVKQTTVSSALSHTILELKADIFSNCWIDGPTSTYALEIVKPVQENTYCVIIDNKKVALSNFVYPSFFGLNTIKNYDYMNILTNPYSTAPGGYLITKKFGTDTREQIFDDVLPVNWKIELEKVPGSRLYKRLSISHIKQNEEIKLSLWNKFIDLILN